MKEKWEVVEIVQGHLTAEIFRGLLEAQGIQVWLNQEGAGVVYGINVGPMGSVEILVPSSAVPQARQILDAYYSGVLEDMDMDIGETSDDDIPETEED